MEETDRGEEVDEDEDVDTDELREVLEELETVVMLDEMDVILEMSTLLGVHRFCPFTTEQVLPTGQQKLKPVHSMSALFAHVLFCCWQKKEISAEHLLDLGLEVEYTPLEQGWNNYSL